MISSSKSPQNFELGLSRRDLMHVAAAGAATATIATSASFSSALSLGRTVCQLS